MTDDERIESVTKDIVNANKLGCTVIRVIHDVKPEILEKLEPAARKYNVKLALEIHAPSYYDSPFEQQLIATFRRVGSPYICFTLDMGVYTKKLPRVAYDRWLREGMKKEIADYIENGYNTGTLPSSHELGVRNAGLDQKILAMGGRQQDIYLAMMGSHGVFGNPALLKEYIPYTSHIHGKCYDITVPEYREYSIPYEDIVPLLIEGGYDGYIDTEYEGNRWIQDAFEVDSTEQVRRHQVMLRQLLGEE